MWLSVRALRRSCTGLPERVSEQCCGVAYAYRLAPHARQECQQVGSHGCPTDSGWFWDGNGIAVRTYTQVTYMGHNRGPWHLRYVDYLLGSGAYILEVGIPTPTRPAAYRLPRSPVVGDAGMICGRHPAVFPPVCPDGLVPFAERIFFCCAGALPWDGGE